MQSRGESGGIGREEEAIMHTLLGIAAIFIGLPLLCLGVLAFVASYNGPGMMALLFGSLLCWGAWKYAKHDDEK
jgi:TRAP-type C4-dicarboxylate transport system permease small subunit